MTISGSMGSSVWNGWVPDTLTKIHTLVDQTAQQMATGKVGNTYASLGGNAALSIDLTSKLSHLDSYGESVSSANLSLSTVNQAITSFTDLATKVTSGPLSAIKATDRTSRASTQTSLRAQLASMLDYINAKDGNSYIFAGRVSETAPALDVATILDGDHASGKAGLSAYVAERQRADLGTTGQGRLAVTLDTGGTGVTLAKEASNPVFGMTVNSVSAGLDKATATLSSSVPTSLDIAFSGVPAAGSSITITFGLPDGGTTDVTLSATSGSPSANQFSVGTDAASTAVNFQTALTTALTTAASTALSNSSALKAAQDFFAASPTSPPQRVLAGPDGTAATATAYQTDAATNAAQTIVWYKGTGVNASEDPRLDRVVPVSPGLTIGIGARGNEPGLADTLAAVAAATVVKFSATDENLAQSQFSDITSRAKDSLSSSKIELQSMTTSFAAAQQQVTAATSQNTATKNVLTTMLSSITDASPEQTAAYLTQLQNQLQVAYQVTAKLMKLSLADYL